MGAPLCDVLLRVADMGRSRAVHGLFTRAGLDGVGLAAYTVTVKANTVTQFKEVS